MLKTSSRPLVLLGPTILVAYSPERDIEDDLATRRHFFADDEAALQDWAQGCARLLDLDLAQVLAVARPLWGTRGAA